MTTGGKTVMRGLGRRLLVAGIAVAATCLGCSDNTPTTPTTTTTTTPALSITPATNVLLIGQTQTYTSTNADSTTASVTWTTSDSGILSIDESGNATAIARGTATLTATSASDTTVAATLQVQVVPSYQGEWSGTTTMTACTDLADFENGGYCAQRLGRSQQLLMSLTQSNLGVSGPIYKTEAGGQVSGTVVGSIGANGDLVQLAGTLTGVVNGASLSSKLIAWNSLATGSSMTGTWATTVTSAQVVGIVTEQWSFTGIPQIVAAASPAASPRNLARMLERR
jgi:Bacterial Ig-like domain (group 2)